MFCMLHGGVVRLCGGVARVRGCLFTTKVASGSVCWHDVLRRNR